jgi:amidase
LQLHGKVRAYKDQFLAAWNETAENGRPIDALICPPAPGVGYPHDFNTYWGYTALFNLVDYPSVILPIKDFKITPELDPVDMNYQPSDKNPYDRANHDICMCIRGPLVNFANKSPRTDDPSLFANQPSTIQVVGRPFEDEDLIQVASALDVLLRAS